MPIPVLEPGALPLFQEYPFDGNIRELRNIVERICAMRSGNVITRENLQNALYPHDLEEEPALEKRRTIKETEWISEQEKIVRALEQCGGRKVKAAALLGIDRSTLWRKMQKYQLL